jgi:hypothetical protein
MGWNRVTISRRDLGGFGLKDDLLGGRYGYRPGLHRLWDHSQEIDLEKPVLQAGTLDLLCLLPRIVNVFSFTSIERSAPAKPATATEIL